jgi:hypothetical protein
MKKSTLPTRRRPSQGNHALQGYHARKLVTTSASEQLATKEGLARLSDHIVGTSTHANMVGTLVVAKIKIATANIMKDGGEIF